MTITLFAVAAGSPSQLASNPIPGTTSITLPRRQGAAMFEVYAGAVSRVPAVYDEASDCALYLWGRAAHPTVPAGQPLLRWIGQVLREDRAIELRDVLGPFVVLIDDRKNQKIRFITDPLGLRPWLVGVHEGRLVAGSHVLEICRAGLSNGKPDYDALACWLYYNQDFTAGSVVEDYRHATPGAITTYDAAGTLLSETEYAPFEYGDKTVKCDQMLDDLHDIVSHDFETLTREADQINLPLSGGYDSRFICALVSRNGLRTRTHATTIHNTDYEVIPARQVTQALGLPLEVVPAMGQHILDLFDDPLAFGAGGLPNGRNLACAVARRRPGMPLLSGFLGDTLMRIQMNPNSSAYYDQDTLNLPTDTLLASAHKYHAFPMHRLDLCRDNLSQRAEERARQVLRRAILRGQTVGKPLDHVDLYQRHRFYYANVFLHHLDVAEAILPYYSWSLLNYHTRHARSSFYPDNYPRLFKRFVPQIADIPHSTYLCDQAKQASGKAHSQPPAPRHLRSWSFDLLRAFTLTADSAIDRKKLLLRLPAGLVGRPRYQNELMFLYKLHAFERQMKECHVELDWKNL